MMDDGSEGNEPKANRKNGKLLVSISVVIVVAVMTIALILASGVLAPRGEGNPQTSDDISSDASENVLVSGVASDFMLGESDIGADWIVSSYNPDSTDHPEVTSASYLHFEQLNSSGDVHFRIEITVMVFDSIYNASTFYDKCIEVHPQDDSNIKPEYRPSYPVIIANVSIGDKGAIMDGPHITTGHEVKWLFFLDKNVVCGVRYHDMMSYDPLPNELLIDLANKVEAKIV